MNTDKPIPEMSDEEVLQIARELQVAYQLKRTPRYSTSWDLAVHNESVAEHIFAFIFLAQYFLPLEDPKGLLDPLRVVRIILFHDFGEIPNGDKPYHTKTKEDEEQEKLDAVHVFSSLPASLQAPSLGFWQEYEEQKTPEAKFVYALDKVEPLFELLDPVNEKSMKRLKFSYEMHFGKKFRATKDFPVLRRFVEAISQDMRKRNVFWEEDRVN